MTKVIANLKTSNNDNQNGKRLVKHNGRDLSALFQPNVAKGKFKRKEMEYELVERIYEANMHTQSTKSNI